jgi:muramoyltetrapeptide carboxypeptidase
MCLRGGYGSNYLLDGLDLRMIATSQAVRRLQRPDRHSTLAARPAWAARVSRAHALGGFSRRRRASGQLSSGSGRRALQCRRRRGLRTLKTGSARGTLYGGCLSILVSLLGTPYEPQTEGKLLFLEDVAPSPTRSTACCGNCAGGQADGVRGIVFGEMLDCVSPGAHAQSAR